MSCYHIYLDSGQKHARVVSSEGEYRALRSSEEQVRNLQNARNGDQNAKMRLVQFNYSGHYPIGIVRGTKRPSNTFGFDIDDKETFERVATLLLASPEEYGLLMLERSASQGGHAVFTREKGKTILENQVRIATQLQCEMDTSAHDINRVYFASTADSEDLLYLSPQLFQDEYVEEEVTAEAETLESRERYGQEELPPNAHKANKHYKPGGPDEGLTAESAEKRRNFLTTENTEETQKFNDDKESAAVLQRNVSVPSVVNNPSGENYQGIPYEVIVKKWWELYNDGKEPEKSNRDVLTFELAVNLRHICGFDRVLLAKVIPCYDEFPLQQKMKCIDSALAEKRTQMPARLKTVLQDIRKDYITDQRVQDAIDEINLEDDMFFFNRFSNGALPQGIIDSIRAAGEAKAMPVITAVAPMVGMLATNVQLDIHGVANGLNLISYICGKAGSGKGSIDPIVMQWMAEIRAQDKLYIQRENEYRERKRQAKNAKDQPVEPKLPVRFLALNNTLPNIAERLANTDGVHSFSFTPEADTVTAKWKSSLSDYSVMLRQAYDGSSYDREAKSAEAVNVHIDRLLWNLTLCGTQDALYRLISNYTDGLLSRLCISRLPDNTYTPLAEKPARMLPEYEDRIRQVAHLLPLMQGTLVLPKLEAKSREWVEKVRLEAMKNNDAVLADARLRGHVNAQRMTACLILCLVAEKLIKTYGFNGAEQRLRTDTNLTQEMALKCQTPAMLDAYEIIADSLIENDMYFFRERMENAYLKNSSIAEWGFRAIKGRNDTIYSRLPNKFSADDAYHETVAEKGSGCNKGMVRQMLKNWKKQGLVVSVGEGEYMKVG